MVKLYTNRFKNKILLLCVYVRLYFQLLSIQIFGRSIIFSISNKVTMMCFLVEASL